MPHLYNLPFIFCFMNFYFLLFIHLPALPSPASAPQQATCSDGSEPGPGSGSTPSYPGWLPGGTCSLPLCFHPCRPSVYPPRGAERKTDGIRGQGGEACTQGPTTDTTPGPEFMGRKSPDLGLSQQGPHLLLLHPGPSSLFLSRNLDLRSGVCTGLSLVRGELR